MSLTNFLFYIPLIILLFLGLFVFQSDMKSRNTRFFLLICTTFSVWMVFNYLVDYTVDPSTALMFARLDFAFASLFSYFFLLFCQIFPSSKFPEFKRIFLWSALPVIFFILSIFTNLVISGVEQKGFGFEIIYGPFEILYDLFVAGYILIGGIGKTFIKFRRAKDIERSQLLLLLVGFFLLTFIAIIANLVLPYMFPNISTITRVGYVGVVLWAIFTGYAIVEKHLFDIRVILTEAASAIVFLALLAQLIFAKTATDRIVNLIILFVVSYGAYLLIKSVQQEIRRRKQLQTLSTQLQHANEHLKELDRMKTEFVSLASHELLTPVSAIEGYLSMLLDEKLARVDDPKAIHYMDRVYRSAKRLARLVTDMLNVSRIEEGRLLVEKKEVSLTGLIEQTIDELKFKAEEKKQKITLLSADHWLTFGDPDKIKEVLVNLIGNSIKYSKEPGTITLSVETVLTSEVRERWQKIENEIKAGPLDDQEAIKSAVDERLKQLIGEKQILIHVKDQGVGIPKEELPKLFKKFHRVGDYTTAESQGTGLGLYISKALVELHHGRIWADSEGSGKGSTFTFSLPEASVQQEIQDLEAQVPQNKEQLKPLAQPPKEAEEM